MKLTYKKTVGFSLALILIIATVISLAACQEKQTSPYNESLIAGLESKAEIDSVGIFSQAGVLVRPNTDKQYISEGTMSMYTEFSGNDWTTMLPDFYRWNIVGFYASVSDYIGRGFDYTNVISFAVDVYNATSRDVALTLTAHPQDMSGVNLGRQIALKGRMNTLVFEVDFLRAQYSGFVKVSQLWFEMDEILTTQESVKLYWDNFRTRDYLEKPDDELTLPTLNAGEISDFEDDYIFHTISAARLTDVWLKTVDFRNITLSKNTKSEYVTSGSRSLKITRYPAVYQTTYWRRWSEVVFPSEYLALAKLWEYDRTKYKIALDVYSDYDYDIGFILQAKASGGHYDTILTLKPKEWVIAELPLQLFTYAGTPFDWQNVTLLFMLNEFFGPTEAVIYVDNLRVVEV